MSERALGGLQDGELGFGHAVALRVDPGQRVLPWAVLQVDQHARRSGSGLPARCALVG